jgi:hypothetical protein
MEVIMEEFRALKKAVMDHYNNDEMVGTTFESAVNALIKGVYGGGLAIGRKEEINKIRTLANKIELPDGNIVYQISAKEIDDTKETEALYFEDKDTAK